MNSDRHYRRDQEDKISSLNRVAADEEQGRLVLALARLDDLLEEFPNDASVLYEKGLLYRDCLGSGVEAYALFTKAYDTARAGAEVRGLAACNALTLAATEADCEKWIAAALRERPQDEQLVTFQRIRAEVEANGLEYGEFLNGLAASDTYDESRPGSFAALLEIIMVSQSLRASEEGTYRAERARLLRALDAQAARTRERLAEDFPPSERLALQRALVEMERACTLDPYNAEQWNFRASWCALLRRHEETLAHADRAIALRPLRYAKPWINKANIALQRGRAAECRKFAETALEQAKAAGDDHDVELAQNLIAYSEQIDRPLTEAGIAKWLRDFNVGWALTAKKEVSVKGGSGGFTNIADGIVKRFERLGPGYHPGQVLIVAELLVYFSPETALAALFETRERAPRVFDDALAVTLLLAVTQPGVRQLDTLRLICLVILAADTPAACKRFYRACIIEVAAADPKFADLHRLVHDTLTAINSKVARWFDDQPPADESGIERARISILSRFQSGTDQQVTSGLPSPPAPWRFALLVGLATIAWVNREKLMASAAEHSALVTAIVVCVLALPLVVAHSKRLIAEQIKRSTCPGCGCPLIKHRSPGNAMGLGSMGTFIDVARMRAGLEGLGGECEKCGGLVCPDCRDPSQACHCGARAWRSVRVELPRRR